MKKLGSAVLIAILASAVIVPAGAQAPRADLTVEDIVEKLAPPPPTRGLRNMVPVKREVELIVNFDFDSARLQSSSVSLLARLAEAMISERLLSLRFRVEGHSDAKGAPDYNQRLSERRAQAVVSFLESQGVAAGRLEALGKGAREPIVVHDPLAAENRRVRVGTLP